ncbi:MAG: leucine-rich repeat domain-containing protein [Thermoguttaceae bacterium]|nr:leucine-rich repeat domain-containing protein [Thermoguttaceae bacterium]
MITTNNIFRRVVIAATLVCFAVFLAPRFVDVSTVRADDGVLISKDGKTLARYPETKTSEIYFAPDGLEAIGPGAFLNCASLKAIVIPEGVKTIGANAFQGCRSLETIALPASLESLGDDAFVNNDALTGIYVPENNKPFRSINGILFSKDGKTLIKCPDAYRFDGNYVVPDGVERIEKRAFANCRQLNVFEFPVGVREIGDGAFAGCSHLISFYVRANNGVVPEDARFFAGPNLRYPHSDGTNFLFSRDGKVFVRCPPGFKQDSYVVSASVKVIADGAFEDCVSLKTIELEEGVEKIGSRAFTGCSSLSTIVIPDSVSAIPDDAFDSPLTIRAFKGSYAEKYAADRGCKFVAVSRDFKLSPDGKTVLEYVGNGSKATVPDGVEILAPTSFANNDPVHSLRTDSRKRLSELKSIVIPASVREFQSVVMQFCFSLEEIDVAEDNPYLRSIDGSLYSKDGKTLFRVPVKYKNDAYAIPEGVEKIGPFAFYYCSSLKSIEVPKSVKTIGAHAFHNCSALESIVIPEGVLVIEEETFSNCSLLKSLVLPKSLQTIQTAAFYRCSSLPSVELSTGVQNIGNFAFGGCSSLKEFGVPETVENLGMGTPPASSFNVAENNPTYRSIDGALYSKDCKTLLRVPNVAGKETFVVPDGVEFVGPYAFSGLASLTSVVLPDSVVEIGESAFSDCSSLTSIDLPKGLRKIGEWAFNRCSSLEKIDIPESALDIGVAAFSCCSSLKKFVFPKNMRIIENQMFGNCDSLREVVIPGGVEKSFPAVFEPLEPFTVTVRAPKGSFAERYAGTWRVKFEPID